MRRGKPRGAVSLLDLLTVFSWSGAVAGALWAAEQRQTTGWGKVFAGAIGTLIGVGCVYACGKSIRVGHRRWPRLSQRAPELFYVFAALSSVVAGWLGYHVFIQVLRVAMSALV